MKTKTKCQHMNHFTDLAPFRRENIILDAKK